MRFNRVLTGDFAMTISATAPMSISAFDSARRQIAGATIFFREFNSRAGGHARSTDALKRDTPSDINFVGERLSNHSSRRALGVFKISLYPFCFQGRAYNGAASSNCRIVGGVKKPSPSECQWTNPSPRRRWRWRRWLVMCARP